LVLRCLQFYDLASARGLNCGISQHQGHQTVVFGGQGLFFTLNRSDEVVQFHLVGGSISLKEEMLGFG
jgi:hypothetical protein